MGLDQYAYAAMRAGQRDEFWETAELDKDTREFTNPNITKPRDEPEGRDGGRVLLIVDRPRG